MPRGKSPPMNPKHRDAICSAGLHLFQELSTLGQQFAHTLLFREGLGRIEPVLPAGTSRPGQPFGGSRSGKVDIRGYLQSSQSLTHSPRLDQWFALRFDSEEEVFLPAVLCSSDHGLQSGKSQLRSVEMSRRDQFYFSEGRTPRLCAPRCMPTPSRSVLPLGVSCRRER